MRLTWLLLMAPTLCVAGEGGYVGREVCAGCHKQIAATHLRTNMARTWREVATQPFPANYFEKFAEGPEPAIHYELQKTGQSLQYRVQMPGQAQLEYPVEAMVGGDRHGISFLFRVPSLDGLKLPLARLLEARYFHYAEKNQLALSLGFPEEKPTSHETSMGRVLTPYLEKRCLGCHGEPHTHGKIAENGVSCENCHGPGQGHVAAVNQHARDLRIFNPKILPVAERMRPCTQCHAGSSIVEDPMPDDALISDQVTALKNSECWRETGGQITCTNCHNPHEDATASVLNTRAEKTCLQCHSTSVTKHAALCPVNRTTGCVGCHMANEIRGAFVIAEHWIRVHPEQNVKVPAANPAWRTTLTPKHLYLRMIAMGDREKAAGIRQQLGAGGSFFELALANSTDRESGVNGGYLGDLEAGKLDPAWAAAALKLQPGEISEVVGGNGKFFLLQRMSRTFREDSEIVFNKAMELRKQGKWQESVNTLLEALKIYPHLLRGMTWLGAMYGQAGNPTVSAGILNIAIKLYPRDAGAHYNLAMAYGALGNADEIAEYRRTLDIDPDYVLAYLNWGGALYAKGQYDEAAAIYRKGIEVNPLLAPLHYNLGLALEQQKKTAESEAEIALAMKIDPTTGKH